MIDEQQWRVGDTAAFVCERGFTAVALQLPDELLHAAADLAHAVHAACAARGAAVQVYILADTTYNSLSVDEVAAAHVHAQCVVHYGRASLTPLSRLPAFFVFPQAPLNVAAAAATLASCSLLAGGGSAAADGGGSPPPVLIFLDQPLLHRLPELQAALGQQLSQRQGPGAAARLVFPTVPRQHMEPQQQPKRAAAGCCGGGGCDQAPQQQQEQPQECCAQAAGPCAAASSEAAPAPAASTDAAQAAAAAAASSSSAGDSSDDGQQLHSLAGYQWRLPAGTEPHDCGLVWVGAPDAPALLHLQLTYSACPWAMLDASLLPSGGGGGQGDAAAAAAAGGAVAAAAAAADGAVVAAALREGLPMEISRALRRRYYLVEKARDAAIVGILVGTLGAAGYADAIARLRRAAAAAGKKSYTLLMGKPSPAKLANFPEIEVFVLVADPQGQVLDCKEYLAPLITPHEALLAWAPDAAPGGGAWDESRYRLDFGEVLEAAALGEDAPPPGAGARRAEPRFSLLSGGYTGDGGSGSDSEGDEEWGKETGDPSTALALHAQQALVVSAAPGGRSDLVAPQSAADYLLHKRSWTGVETPLVGAAPAPVAAAVEGRSGRAAGYVDEPARVAAAAAAAATEQQQQ